MESTTVHYYYGDPKWLNLDKIREEALQISTSDRMGPKRTVIIHFHKEGTSCASINGETPIEHETYFATDKE